VVTFYGHHALGWGSEKKNHTDIFDFSFFGAKIHKIVGAEKEKE